jgi:hypothetical protein
MDSLSKQTRLNQSLRREWQAPRVFQGALEDSESKTHGAATPDSHYLSNDYGNTS